MKAIPNLSLLFRDAGRVILLDKIGCVYNLNLRDKECSCGEESGTCTHFTFASKSLSTSRCLICVRDNADGEAMCGSCFALYHQLCVDRRKAYGMRVCLHCGAEWTSAPLRLCYYCGCQVKGTTAICAFCPGMDICLACYQSLKHCHQAYIMEDDGLIKTPHSDPLLGYLPLLPHNGEEVRGNCTECDDTTGSLALLKCGHTLHLDCLAQSIRQRRLNCVICLSPYFKGINRSLQHFARRQPAALTLRSLDRSILSQVHAEFPSREISPMAQKIGISVTPKAARFASEGETLPPITPLKLKSFQFNGGGGRFLNRKVNVEAIPAPLNLQKEVSRKRRKQSDLSILNLSLAHDPDTLFYDWNKLPGRFLSRSKGIKKYTHPRPPALS